MLRLLVVAVAACAPWVFPKVAHGDDSVPTAWQLQAGTAGLLTAPPPAHPATICVIDTGVTPTPDLDITARDTTLAGGLDDVQAQPGRPGHGTVVAHFAAGRVNGWGGAGAFPHARIASVRVFPEAGATRWETYSNAINRCHKIDAHTKVLLIALGGSSIDAVEAADLKDRIAGARRDYGFNVVVAAGNGGGPVDYPGAFPESFTVAATDGTGGFCDFSARGTGVDLAAPGCGVEQAGWEGGMWALDGTSFAAPIVAGVLAALRSYQPEMGPDEAERLLVDTGRAGVVPELDAGRALASVGVRTLVDAGGETVEPSVSSATAPQASAPGHNSSESKKSPLRGEPVDSTRLRSPRFRVTRLRGKRLRIRVSNRPRGALLQVRRGSQRRTAATGQLVMSLRGSAVLRLRFVTEVAASRWVRTTIPVR